MLQVEGFKVVIFLPPREHPPAHVHVRKAAGEAIIILSPVSIRSAAGMSRTEIVQAVRIVEDNHQQLMAEWRKLHG